MIELQYTVLLPIATGIVLFLFPERINSIKGVLSLIVSAVVLFFSYRLFQLPSGIASPNLLPGLIAGLPVDREVVTDLLQFNIDSLSKMIILFIGFFGFLFSLYSLSYIRREKKLSNYYSYFLITVGVSIATVLSDHFLLFITLWGVLGLTLYKLIKGYNEESSAAAKKTFILIGASDSIMIFGIGVLWVLAESLRISEITVPTTNSLGVIAFVALLIGSLTKAGAFPFHTWVPEYVERAPASSSALLPASLDKLLGIYLLARICMNLFVLNHWLRLTLLIIGGLSTITAVFMALIQHNYKKLLGYHAVSQVGYMITGFGLGTPIGIAGGLFHMFNNALYKSGLFLTAGSIEKRTGCEDLDKLGGLSRLMPLTFFTALIFALSISGVPPFNGFASKWILYQGIIDLGRGVGPANSVWIVWLILAVFGSALTLASFIKFISGIYLGGIKEELKETREVSILMWLPQLIIALVCIGFGIFATTYVVPNFVKPLSGDFQYEGIWASSAITGLIGASIILGFIVYLLGAPARFRRTEAFVGGETLQEKTNFSSPEFYKTVSNLGILSFFYKKAEKKVFDIYDNTKNLILGVNTALSKGHAGVLSLYTLWVILGLIIIVMVLLM